MPIPDIDVWQGEIGELEVDAIIVPANESLFMTGPTASVLKRHAGDEVEREAVSQGPIPAGSVAITSAGNLAASILIHAVGVGHDLRADARQLRRALDAALGRAEELGMRRIAVAPPGIERGVFSAAEVAPLLLEVAAGHGELSIVIAVTSAADAAAFNAAIDAARVEAR
ncbi:MAG TPA: macro domain-containing protein [Candidatus Limnocylindria bacterium]|nr:macro domain-containing protein [Candidatus Limnocylindria bacterium]